MADAGGHALGGQGAEDEPLAPGAGEDERLAGEVAGAHGPALGERVGGREDGEQLVGHQRLKLEAVVLAGRDSSAGRIVADTLGIDPRRTWPLAIPRASSCSCRMPSASPRIARRGAHHARDRVRLVARRDRVVPGQRQT